MPQEGRVLGRCRGPLIDLPQDVEAADPAALGAVPRRDQGDDGRAAPSPALTNFSGYRGIDGDVVAADERSPMAGPLLVGEHHAYAAVVAVVDIDKHPSGVGPDDRQPR